MSGVWVDGVGGCKRETERERVQQNEGEKGVKKQRVSTKKKN